MSVALRSALGRAFRRAALPLGWYYAVTLGLPLANGAAQTGGVFVGHALTVLVVPPILIGLVCTVDVVVRRVSGCMVGRDVLPAAPRLTPRRRT